MNLQAWLDPNRLSHDAFAKRMGVSQPTISRMVLGRIIRGTLALAVELETGGDVKAGQDINVTDADRLVIERARVYFSMRGLTQ